MVRKKLMFHDRHFSYSNLIESIFTPKWRSIRNPKEKLISDVFSFD